MTTPGPVTPGYPPGHPGRFDTQRQSRAVWWVVAGVVTIVVVGIVVWRGILGTVDDLTNPHVGSTITDAARPTTPTMGGVTTPTPTVDEWASFPPPNASALPDLSNPQLPAQVLTYALAYETKDSFSLIADYTDDETFVTLTLWFTTERSDYARTIALLQDPARFGGAVCGLAIAGAEQLNCVMVGRAETVRVMTSSSDVTIADVATFTEALYAGL